MNLTVVLSRLTGILSLILGAMVLLGWYLHEPALIQVSPAFVPMQYNTALGFALAGLALLGLAWSKPGLAKVAGSVTLVIGALTLIEYIFATDLNIDQLFMEHYIDNSSSNPGRMAPNTALCFSLTGIAVLLTSLYHDRKTMSTWCAIFGALIISLGITALAGYMIGVEGAYGWGHMTRMAIHTSAGFTFLGLGLISYSWGISQSMFPEKVLPAWLPQVIGITGLTITFALWQAVSAKEQRMISEMGEAVANFSDESLLLFGLLLTIAILLISFGLAYFLFKQKLAEAEIKAEKTRADEANQAKGAFLANMSHELRTPMNAILGYSEMLIEDAEGLEQDNFAADLKKINQAGNHLLSLINDVLDLSRVESGKMDAYPEDIDLNEMIDEVSATALPLFEQNNNTLVIDRGEALGIAHQDLTKLRQNLFNLLSNAAKFTHEGTITLHVSRAVKDGVDWLTLSVSDTGIGIAKDKIDHVFEEFAQADGSTTRDYGGTGLGLAISRRFCELLGGDLSATSEAGKGSTFTMRIPAVFPGSIPQPVAEASANVQENSESPTVNADRSDATILAIDDDPEALEIIERFLHKDGFSVVKASSGEEGIRLAREIRPTAITLDVMMPDMNGWSVLRLLKADAELSGIPVIMLSMLDDRTRGYALGAVDYLTKPVDRDLLKKTLSRYHAPGDDCPVLVVEDDEETRNIIAQTLRNAGWTVAEAINGQDALDMMSSLQPGLIILDLIMPVMDGFGFISALREQPEWRHIPVIVNTAKDLSPADHEKLSGRVEDVMEKSAYTMDQLLEHVRNAVSRLKTNK